MSKEGLVIRSSNYGPKETMMLLVAAVTSRGMTIVSRIDHAGAAAKAGLELRPTEVLIFGDPKVGTHLMQASQVIGLDLPLRMLVWQDESGRTRLAYHEPKWLAKAYGADIGTEEIVAAMSHTLTTIAKEATA